MANKLIDEFLVSFPNPFFLHGPGSKQRLKIKWRCDIFQVKPSLPDHPVVKVPVEMAFIDDFAGL